MDVREVTGFLIGLLVVFVIAGSFITPLDQGVRQMEGAINGSISGETLGEANAGGGVLVTNTSYPVDENQVYEVLNASGVAHTSWVNTSINFSFQPRYTQIDIAANGTPNSTSGNALTINYYRSNTQAEDLSTLPSVAYLIALISVLVGFLILAGKWL